MIHSPLLFIALSFTISYQANAIGVDSTDTIETITAEYDDLTRDEAQRLENATVLSVKYLMKTQRDLKKKSYSRAREELKAAQSYAHEAYHMLPTSIVRDKIEVAKLALDAEEDTVFVNTLVPIYSQVEASDVYSGSTKDKITKHLENSKSSLKKGDRKAAKNSMDMIMGEVNSIEVDVDVVNLVNVCDQALEQISNRKFTSAQKTISNSDVFFVYYSDELIAPSSNDKRKLAH